MAADHETRELVAQSCRILGGLGLTKAATGHVSALSPDGKYVLVRARGRDERGVRYTQAEQIIATGQADLVILARAMLDDPH